MKRRSLIFNRLSKFRANKPAMLGFVVICFIVIISIVGPFVLRLEPNKINMAAVNKPPSEEAIFGTDALGRDVFSRVIYGGRISIFIGVISSGLSAALGTALGIVGGYLRGVIDRFLIRLSELLQTLPRIIVVMFVVSIVGSGVRNLVAVFILTGWMTVFRIVRNEVLTCKEETYISVAEVLGISSFNIMFSEILPNVMSSVIVALTMNIPYFILQETSLSYIGLGVPNSIPTWGTIINSVSSVSSISGEWWLWVIPGSILVVFCVAINFVGDGLRDALDAKTEAGHRGGE